MLPQARRLLGSRLGAIFLVCLIVQTLYFVTLRSTTNDVSLQAKQLVSNKLLPQTTTLRPAPAVSIKNDPFLRKTQQNAKEMEESYRKLFAKRAADEMITLKVANNAMAENSANSMDLAHRPWPHVRGALAGYPRIWPAIDEAAKHLDDSKPNGRKVILYWDAFFGDPDFGVGDHTASFLGCEYSNCWATRDMRYYNQSAAVLFHADSFTKMPLQPRPPVQRWVIFNAESPVHSNMPYSSMFNWTMSYHSGSDVFAPHGPLFLRRLPNFQNTPVKLNVVNSSAENKLMKVLSGNLDDLWHVLEKFALPKTKLAYALISNCDPTSGRMQIIKHMKQLMPIDNFGACFEPNCPLDTNGRCQYFMLNFSRYKFFLAFENSLCKDYITEKLYNRAIFLGVVPVVRGGLSRADYELLLPAGSFIYYYDFPTPEKLIDYLMYLDRNNTAYMEYHAWRRQYVQRKADGFCQLCIKSCAIKALV